MRPATRTGYAPFVASTVPFFRRPTAYALTPPEKRRLLRSRGPVYCAWPGRHRTHVFRVIKRRALQALAGRG